MWYALGGAMLSAAVGIAIADADRRLVLLIGLVGLTTILVRAAVGSFAPSGRDGEGVDSRQEKQERRGTSLSSAATLRTTPEMERQIAATIAKHQDARREQRKEIDRLILQGERIRDQFRSPQIVHAENPVVRAEEWEEEVCTTLERIPRMDLKTDFQRPVARAHESQVVISPDPHTMQVKLARLRIIAGKL